MTVAMITEPGVLYALLPLVVIFAGLLTFELAMGVTIATLPRSRFQQKWTDAERRRVMRVFLATFSIWPIGAMLVVSHVYLGTGVALIADAVAVGLMLLALRWFVRCARERQLILAGHCVNCFYDLRASHESLACPECGTDLEDHPHRVEDRKRRRRNAERARKAAQAASGA